MDSNQEINTANKDSSNLEIELKKHLSEISMKMDKLIDKFEPEKKKEKRDNWDKFQIISSFFSSVLLAGVGIIFTLIYNNREKQSQIEIQKAQQRVTELQALISLTPLLASDDSGIREKASIILKALNQSDSSNNEDEGNLLDSYIALVNKIDVPLEKRIEANKKITDIALSPFSTESETKTALISISKTASSNDVPPKLKDAASNSLDNITQRNLSGLRPDVAELAKKLMELAKNDSITLRIIRGYTSPEAQDSLYAIGRTKPGSKITNAKGGQSSHNTGLAFDVGIFIDGRYEPRDKYYEKLGKYARRLGLTWGGDFSTFKDYPHFQLGDFHPLKK